MRRARRRAYANRNGADLVSTGLCDNRSACRAGVLALKNRTQASKVNDNVVPLFGRKVEAPRALAA